MKDDLAVWALKQKVPLRWLLTTILAMLGGFALSVKLGSSLNYFESRLEANEKAIIKNAVEHNLLVNKLEMIDQRLSRIEGSLNILIREYKEHR